MNKVVNVAIQFLPQNDKGSLSYALIDKAIEVIQKSGLKYKVCPFETVVEGDYETIMRLIFEMHQACYQAGAEEIISFIKIHSSKNQPVRMSEKFQKYEL
ncbi:MAG: MTH1187 family thiamine-binding protein [Flammeovirgaceae bacterium]